MITVVDKLKLVTEEKRKPGRPRKERPFVLPAPPTDDPIECAHWHFVAMAQTFRSIFNNFSMDPVERLELLAKYSMRLTQSMPNLEIHRARETITADESIQKIQRLDGKAKGVEKTRARSIRPKAT